MLSLHVAKANADMGPEALVAGLQLAACVRSVEDHGFLLDIGVEVGFLLTRSHSPCHRGLSHKVDLLPSAF